MSCWFALLLTLTACGPDAPAPAPDAAPEERAPEIPPLDKATLASSASTIALVPSPVETQRALAAAGVEAELATLVPAHAFDLSDTGDRDRTAVRTGVVLADLLLTVKTADKADLLARMTAVRAGLATLGAGERVDRDLGATITSVEADAASRDELLKTFDELVGSALPELDFGDTRTLPLLQAGAWLEGAHLVAAALKARKTPGAADTLLKQPDVVRYFQGFVTAEGPSPLSGTLHGALKTLEGVASKAEPLAAEDVDAVLTATSDVLGLL